MAVDILESAFQVAGAGDASLSDIADGSVVVFFQAARDGSSVDGDGVTETGPGTYTQIAAVDYKLGSSERLSVAVDYLEAGTGEDTTLSSGAGDATGWAAAEIDLDGNVVDWANAIVVSGSTDAGGGNYTSVTSATTSSLAGNYLSIAVAVTKLDSTYISFDEFNQSHGITTHEDSTPDFYYGMSISARYGAYSGTQSLTANEQADTSFDSSSTVIWILVPEFGSTDQDGYRFFDDDDVEGSATTLAAEDTDITGRASATNTRLRVQMDTTDAVPSSTWTLQYRKVGDAAVLWEDLA